MRAMIMRAISATLPPEPLRSEEVPMPCVSDPHDVVVRIAAAGVCRTDLHLLTGELAAPLPLVLGHENAGWVHEVGSQVSAVAVGDPVVCYPFVSSGLSVTERSGLDSGAPDRATPGITVDGGYAEYLLTNERAMMRVPPDADLAELCTLTDAGLAAYRASARAAALTRPGDVAIVIGVGGLGHLAVQILKALCVAYVVAIDIDPAARALALECGAEEALLPGDERCAAARARVVLDFVGSDTTGRFGLDALQFGGTYLAVGVGGTLSAPVADIVTGEKRIEGVFVGTYGDLSDVVELAVSGKVTPRVTRYPLADANRALHDLAAGRVLGRAVLVPG